MFTFVGRILLTPYYLYSMRLQHVFFGLVLLSQISCNDKQKEDETPQTAMSASIGTHTWTSQNNPLLTPKAFVKNGWLVISPDLDCGVRLVLDGFAPGIYKTGRNHFAYGLAQSADCSTLYYANHKDDDTGEIILTEVNTQDSTVSGTFSFRAYNTAKNEAIEVKNGQFTKVPFTWLDKGINLPERLTFEKNGRVIAMAGGKVQNGGAMYNIATVDEEGHVVVIRIPNNADLLDNHSFKAGGDFNSPLIQTVYAGFKYAFEKAPIEAYSVADGTSSLTVEHLDRNLPGALKFRFEGNLSNSTDPKAKIQVKGFFEGDLQ